MKKRLLAMLLCASMLFTVTACGDGKKANTEDGATKVENPSVTALADYSDLAVVYAGDYEINDEVILNGFSGLLENAGVAVEWTEVTDRDTIQEGDIVNLDYTGYLDGEAFSGGSATDQLIDVSNNCSVDETTGAASTSYIDGFTSGLLGAKVGETISSDVTFPEGYNDTLGGKTTTFEFTINGIYTYEAYTPENIDDAFVAANLQEYYDVATVDELMAYIEEELRYQAFVGYAVENSTVEIPDSYLDARLDAYETYFKEKYCSEDLTLENLLAYYYNTTIEDARESWREGLKSQAKIEIIFTEIVKNENLALDEKELEEYIQSILSNGTYFTDETDIFKYAGAGDADAGKNYLLNETAVRNLIIELNEQ